MTQKSESHNHNTRPTKLFDIICQVHTLACSVFRRPHQTRQGLCTTNGAFEDSVIFTISHCKGETTFRNLKFVPNMYVVALSMYVSTYSSIVQQQSEELFRV